MLFKLIAALIIQFYLRLLFGYPTIRELQPEVLVMAEKARIPARVPYVLPPPGTNPVSTCEIRHHYLP